MPKRLGPTWGETTHAVLTVLGILIGVLFLVLTFFG